MTETNSEIRPLTAEEIDSVGGGVWGVVGGAAVGALIFMARAGQEAYLARETAWYAAR